MATIQKAMSRLCANQILTAAALNMISYPGSSFSVGACKLAIYSKKNNMCFMFVQSLQLVLMVDQ